MHNIFKHQSTQIVLLHWHLNLLKQLTTQCFLQTSFFQPPLVCVNAAGITQDDFMLNMEEDKFDRVIQVNLKVCT